MEIFENFVSVLVIAMMFVNVAVTWKLWSFAKSSRFKYPALNERTFSAAIKTVGSLAIGAVAINRMFDLGWWEPQVGFVLLLISIVLHAFPPLLWVYYYATGKFADPIEKLGLDK